MIVKSDDHRGFESSKFTAAEGPDIMNGKPLKSRFN